MYLSSLSVNKFGAQQKRANPALVQILHMPPAHLQASSIVVGDLKLFFYPQDTFRYCGSRIFGPRAASKRASNREHVIVEL